MNVHPLVDHFVVAGLNEAKGIEPQEMEFSDAEVSVSPLQRFYKPHLLYFTPQESGTIGPLRDVELLCFPRGIRFKKDGDNKRIACHTFVMTRENYDQVYGVCLTFYEKVTDENILMAMKMLEMMHLKQLECFSPPSRQQRSRRRSLPVLGTRQANFDPSHNTLYAPKAICILSTVPAVSCFERYLRQLYLLSQMARRTTPYVDLCVSNLLHSVPRPPPGSSVRFSCLNPITCAIPDATELPLFEHSLLRLFSLFKPRMVLKLLAYAMLEGQILIRSQDLELLVLVAECLRCLMFPFQWQHVYVPILPFSAISFVEAPVPFIMGLHTDFPLPEESQVPCTVDITTGTIVFPEDEETIDFPDSEALVDQLKALIKRSGTSSGCANFLGGAKTFCDIVSGVSLQTSPNNPGTSSDLHFSQLVREAILKVFVHIMCGYESYMILPTSPAKGSDTHQDLRSFTFDKLAFLSDIAPEYQPFMSRFIETQLFSAFTSAKALQIVRKEGVHTRFEALLQEEEKVRQHHGSSSHSPALALLMQASDTPPVPFFINKRAESSRAKQRPVYTSEPPLSADEVSHLQRAVIDDASSDEDDADPIFEDEEDLYSDGALDSAEDRSKDAQGSRGSSKSSKSSRGLLGGVLGRDGEGEPTRVVSASEAEEGSTDSSVFVVDRLDLPRKGAPQLVAKNTASAVSGTAQSTQQRESMISRMKRRNGSLARGARSCPSSPVLSRSRLASSTTAKDMSGRSGLDVARQMARKLPSQPPEKSTVLASPSATTTTAARSQATPHRQPDASAPSSKISEGQQRARRKQLRKSASLQAPFRERRQPATPPQLSHGHQSPATPATPTLAISSSPSSSSSSAIPRAIPADSFRETPTTGEPASISDHALSTVPCTRYQFPVPTSAPSLRIPQLLWPLTHTAPSKGPHVHHRQAAEKRSLPKRETKGSAPHFSDKLEQRRTQFSLSLMKECKQKVQNIVLLAASQAESNRLMQRENTLAAGICDLLERVFRNGVRTQTKSPLWHFLQSSAKTGTLDPEAHACIGTVSKMAFLHSDVGRGRAWVRLMLERQQLSPHLELCFKSSPVILDLYKAYAFLSQEDLRTQLLSYLLSLSTVRFSCFTDNYPPVTVSYTITIFTAKSLLAGTTSSVSYAITGQLGTTGVISAGKSPQFGKGAQYTHTFLHPNLGTLTEVMMTHDNTGLSSAWTVDLVEIVNNTTRVVTKFPCFRRIAKASDADPTILLPMRQEDEESDDLNTSIQRQDHIVLQADAAAAATQIQREMANAVNVVVRFMYDTDSPVYTGDASSDVLKAQLILGEERVITSGRAKSLADFPQTQFQLVGGRVSGRGQNLSRSMSSSSARSTSPSSPASTHHADAALQRAPRSLSSSHAPDQNGVQLAATGSKTFTTPPAKLCSVSEVFSKSLMHGVKRSSLMFSSHKHPFEVLEKCAEQVDTHSKTDPGALLIEAVQEAKRIHPSKQARFEFVICFGTAHHVLHVWIHLCSEFALSGKVHIREQACLCDSQTVIALSGLLRFLVDFKMDFYAWMAFVPATTKGKGTPQGKWAIKKKSEQLSSTRKHDRVVAKRVDATDDTAAPEASSKAHADARTPTTKSSSAANNSGSNNNTSRGKLSSKVSDSKEKQQQQQQPSTKSVVPSKERTKMSS